MLGYGQQAGGTHPTGMHAVIIYKSSKVCACQLVVPFHGCGGLYMLTSQMVKVGVIMDVSIFNGSFTLRFTTRLRLCTHFYHPQQSYGKVMFYTCLSFCSQGGGVCNTPLSRHPPTPEPDTPRADTPPCSACWDTVNKRVVRILLECILVYRCDCDSYSTHEKESQTQSPNKLQM